MKTQEAKKRYVLVSYQVFDDELYPVIEKRFSTRKSAENYKVNKKMWECEVMTTNQFMQLNVVDTSYC